MRPGNYLGCHFTDDFPLRGRHRRHGQPPDAQQCHPLQLLALLDLDERHRMGFKVFLFLIVATGVFYAAKRKIWSRIDH